MVTFVPVLVRTWKMEFRCQSAVFTSERFENKASPGASLALHVSSSWVTASDSGSPQARWMVIKVANENHRLTKAELMSRASLCGVLRSLAACFSSAGDLMPKQHLSDGFLGDEKLCVIWEVGRGGGVCSHGDQRGDCLLPPPSIGETSLGGFNQRQHRFEGFCDEHI